MSVDGLDFKEKGFKDFFTKNRKRKNSIYDYDLHRYLIKYERNDMTYILGAKCSDGVVLVGDTKVTIDDGADYTYSNKIFNPFNTVVMGSAGISGLYKTFQNRIVTAVRDYNQEGHTIDTVEKFSILTESVIRDMHEIYGEDRHILRNLSVLLAVRMGEKAEIMNFTHIGFPEPINSYKAIGHGEPYGAIFLKKLWTEHMTMEKVALLSCFIIKVIQESKIDNSVGYSEEYPPQVWYIPDIKYPNDMPPFATEDEQIEFSIQLRDIKYRIRELEKKEVKSLLNRISNQVEDFNSFFVNGDFKLF